MMKEKIRVHKLPIVLLVIAAAVVAAAAAAFFRMPALGQAENTAATMQLAKTEGTVDVIDSGEKNISLIDQMNLYSGYEVATREESYAWIELDRVKMAKLDAVSKAGIRKSGKKLEILLDSGNLFFNIDEPLKSDESLNIRTSTMVVGIRGTSGWVEIIDEQTASLSVLEGSVEMSIVDPVTGESKLETVGSGETAVCTVNAQGAEGTRCGIVRENQAKEDISGFVLKEVAANASLAEKIYKKGGLDLRDVTEEEAKAKLIADEEMVRQKMEAVDLAYSGQAANTSAEAAWTDAGTDVAGEDSVTVADSADTAGDSADGTDALNPFAGGTDSAETSSGGTDMAAASNTASGGTDTAAASNASSGGTAAANTSNASSGGTNVIPAVLSVIHRITFDMQGAGNREDQMVPEGGTVQKPSDAIRDGYVFTGWFTDRACTNKYNFSAAVRGSFTLYAGWKTVPKLPYSNSLVVVKVNHRVAFDTGLGIGIGPSVQIVADGERVIEPPALTREGSVFTGWYTDAACVAKYDFSAPVRGSFILYAGWIPVLQPSVKPAVYHVLFDGKGGLILPASLASQTVAEGGKAVEPASVTRDGYIFTGWYTDEACMARYDFAAPVRENLKLYAGWEAQTEPPAEPVVYHIQLDARGGSILPAALANQTVTDGERAVEPDSVTRERYVFTGWYTDEACTARYDFSAAVNGDMTLYAGWTPKVHRVIFDANGGSGSSEQSVTDGERAAEPAAVTWNGYTFTGWYKDAECMERYDFSAAVSGDMTLYAGWDPKMHRITFDGNGGTGAADQFVAEGGKAAAPAAPTRDGYRFTEWYRDAACRERYSFSAVVTRNLTLYAGWERVLYSVKGHQLIISIDGPMQDYDETFNGRSNAPWDEYLQNEGITSLRIVEGASGIGDYAFQNGKYLTEVVLPGGLTKIGNGAFKGCSRLTDVAVPGGVTSIGTGAFDGCSALTNVTLPDGLTNIGVDAFIGCSALADIVIPGSVTDIGEGAFMYCTSLTGITIPDGVRRIKDEAFAGCTSLTGITLPESITSIGGQAFMNCSSLAGIGIPFGIGSIGDRAFSGCSSLATIYFGGAQQQWEMLVSGRNIFDGRTPVVNYSAQLARP